MKTFLSVIFLWTFHFNCTAQWVALNVGNVNATNFSDVYAISTDIVIVTGTNGTILKTTDGGVTWQQKSSGTNKILKKISFVDSMIGYIIGEGGTFLKTNDGGENWTNINTGITADLQSFSLVNENLIYVAYENHLLFSTNGGSTWQTKDLDFGTGDVQFFSQGIGFASKSNGGLAKTINNGVTWQDMQGIRTFNFTSDKIGFYYDGGFRKTIDGGDSFQYLAQGKTNFLSKIFVINENTVWGIFNEQTLCWCVNKHGVVKLTYSPENGYKESVEYQNNNVNFSSFYFVNDKLGYAVGVDDTKAMIWKNTTGVTLATKEIDLKYNIKIYPNPTSDKINISISNQYSKDYTISMSDMTGKSVYNQSFKNKNDLIIDAKNFAKGTYVLILKNQKQSYSQKIIIN